VRSLDLLLDASPESAEVADEHGLLPLHWLCSNPAIGEPFLTAFLEWDAAAADAADAYGQRPVHMLCQNEAISAGMLSALVSASPAAASTEDAEGNLALHFLGKTLPEHDARSMQLWRTLLAAMGA
jgi:hypothetical protein